MPNIAALSHRDTTRKEIDNKVSSERQLSYCMHSLAKHEDFDRRHTQKLILRLIENRVIRVYLNGGEEKCAERRILSIVGFFFFVFILHWCNCAKHSRFSVDSGILHP